MNFKILNTIGEVYTPEARTILEKLGKVDYKNLTQNELLEIISQYDILLVGLGLSINKEIITRGEKLKVIATATTGLDHINIGFAEEQGIHILSLKGENNFLDTVTGTAELAFGLIINLCRQITLATESVQRGEWRRENFRGHNLSEKTLGIVGMGRLGKMMGRYGLAFGMRVIFFDPYVNQDLFPQYKKVSFEQLANGSDIISIHVHLNSETENMFSKEVFEKMKPSAYLINTSRDRIVNEADLIDALRAKRIVGYAADVVSGEIDFGVVIPSGHPLIVYSKDNSNVIIVPHIGGMTFESRTKTDVFIAEKIRIHLAAIT